MHNPDLPMHSDQKYQTSCVNLLNEIESQLTKSLPSCARHNLVNQKTLNTYMNVV